MSLAGHGAAAFGLVLVVHLASLWVPREPTLTVVSPQKSETTPHAPAPDPGVIEVELPEVPLSSPLFGQIPEAVDPASAPIGGARVARLDQRHPGRGGDDRAIDHALNLADQDDRITMDPSVFSSMSVSQLSRIDRGSLLRQSFENQRSSREPMELTFVAMGERGTATERRPEAAINPARGMRTAARRSDLGGPRGEDPLPDGEGERERVLGADHPGSRQRATGAGSRDGTAMGPESVALENAHARPQVNTSDPSVAAVDEGRPSDTVESEQATAARMQAFMHASTLGGSVLAAGNGGEGGGGPAGAGGSRGAGQSATVAGAGGKGPGDIAREGYVRGVLSKVHPLWANAFPKWAIAKGLSGTATVSFTIEADGSVSNVRVTRPSGIDEFDKNVVAAVLRGAPYGKLPDLLGPRLNMSIPFAANNPAVRPKNPKDGM
ncbi:MAG: energy transducer TonB [Polyangiaceae bacterium]